jgi:disulfide bond formation protein DsbB
MSLLKFVSGLKGQGYWWLLLLTGIGLEAGALFFQYVLDYGPCPLCIHVRIGVAILTIVALSALLIRSRAWRRFAHVVNTAALLWMVERAYLLLGTERGFVYLECGIDSGLPAWFALDQWFPLMFGVTESCGYTPVLAFGVRMAEALIVLFPLMLLLSLVGLVYSFFDD